MFLECIICMESFEPPCIPKSMPDCPHTFCLKCLKVLEKETASTGQIICPECRTPNRLGRHGVEAFQTNLAVQRIVEELMDTKLQNYTHKQVFQENKKNVASVQEHSNDNGRSPGVGLGSIIDPTATIEPGAIIGSNCVIEADVAIKTGAVVCSDVTVGRGAIVGNDVTVHSDAMIGPGATIQTGCFVGTGAKIGANATLKAGSCLAPGRKFGL